MGDNITIGIEVENQSLAVFQWQDWRSTLFCFLLIIFGFIPSVGGKGMIVHYIISRNAFKGRPINLMLLIDQVNFLCIFKNIHFDTILLARKHSSLTFFRTFFLTFFFTFFKKFF